MDNQKKEKVCYILPEYNPETDTHFAYLYKLIKNTTSQLNYFLIVEKTDDNPNELEVEKVKIVNSSNYFVRLFKYLSFVKEAIDDGYKNIYVHYSYIGALAAIFITFIFGGRVFYWNCGMPWLYKRNLVKELVMRFIFKQTILVTGTESMAKLYSGKYGVTDYKIFPNWVDTKEFQNKCVDKLKARRKLNLPEDKEIILFVHHLSKRKGADKIVPTAKKMKKKDGKYFVVVGDGPLLEDLKMKSRDLPVKVEGKVSHSQIPLYFSAADIFFMPSEEEGFPHVLLESMASGTPYVATEVGGVRDISPKEEQKFILSNSSPENFVNTLQDISNNPPSSRKLKTHLKKYDFDTVKDKFVNVFKK